MKSASRIAVIGGGILGLAVGRTLAERGYRVTLIEKEAGLAQHQTGHNSGVIHAGIYYRPGSAKARTCVRGAEMMKRLCAEHGVEVNPCGKVIVATDESERPALEELHRKGQANGLPDIAFVGPERLHELEPHAAGVAALHVPGTAIVDYRSVAEVLAGLLRDAGGDIRTGTRVTGLRREVSEIVLETTGERVRASFVVSCAGLYSDRVAALDRRVDERIVPFRGEYYELVPERRELVRGLIYPVPDPRFPFLGVHFTLKVDGGVEAGPNAVLALAREGYGHTQVHLGELASTLSYPGFWRLAARYWRTGIGEWRRSLSKGAFTRALQKLVPEIRAEDLRPGGAGVRAQALDRQGKLLDDFLFVEGERSLHVCNAPSPAATASLAIAEEIAERVLMRIGSV